MNGQAFDGDTILQDTIEALIKDYGIRSVVETGSRDGDTTITLAKMAHRVYGIERNLACHMRSQTLLANYGNAMMLLGDSAQVLPELLALIEHPVLAYLDAHGFGFKDWPLLNEIRAFKPYPEWVIVIHDCQVPGRHFGFDSYDGQDLNPSYVLSAFMETFVDFRYWFNQEAVGAQRGVMYAAHRLPKEPLP